MRNPIAFSVVIPVLNEEDTIPEMLARLDIVIPTKNTPLEVSSNQQVRRVAPSMAANKNRLARRTFSSVPVTAPQGPCS